MITALVGLHDDDAANTALSVYIRLLALGGIKSNRGVPPHLTPELPFWGPLPLL